MQPPEQVAASFDIPKINHNIDALSDDYVLTILNKVRKYLLLGPFYNPNEPYNGFILRGLAEPSNRYIMHNGAVSPAGLLSTLFSKTIFLPKHAAVMLNNMQSAEISKKDKLKHTYQTCKDAASSNSFWRDGKTQWHYAMTIRGIIELMTDPAIKTAYEKIISNQLENSEEILNTFSNKLFAGLPNSNPANPYAMKYSGKEVQTPSGTTIKVPDHVDVLLSFTQDTLLNNSKKLKKIFYGLIDSIISLSLTRSEAVENFYQQLLNNFTTAINNAPIRNTERIEQRM